MACGTWSLAGRRRAALVLAAALAALLGAPTTVQADGGFIQLAYNSSPTLFPGLSQQPIGNVISAGFECCQSGSWDASKGICTTTPGTYFTVPVTATVYAVGSDPTTPGAVLAQVTQTVAVPFRPTSTPAQCGNDNTEWYNSTSATCYRGLAVSVPFVFLYPNNPVLPAAVIWTVAFNTSTSGYHPLGTGTACFSTSAGCPYDSLNVGTETFKGQPSAGADVYPNGWFVAYNSASDFCPGGAGGTVGKLGLDNGCHGAYTPLATITTSTF